MGNPGRRTRPAPDGFRYTGCSRYDVDRRASAVRLTELRWINLDWRSYQPIGPRTNIVANVIAIGRSVEAGLRAHAVSDRVVCTGRIAGYAETAYHLSPAVERNTAAE